MKLFVEKRKVLHVAHGEIDSESCWIKPILDFNYTFPIDVVPNGVLFGAKSIGEV